MSSPTRSSCLPSPASFSQFPPRKVSVPILLTSEQLLEDMRKPEGYSGPELEIVVKDSKLAPEQYKELLTKIVAGAIPSGTKVGLFQKNDKVDGPLTQSLLDVLQDNKNPLGEMMDVMGHVCKTKLVEEV